MQGNVFNIQKFCTSDGPGIRTTVFLKGCPLRCEWCHNPESHSFECETAVMDGVSETYGKYMSVEEVMEEVLEDQMFYRNSGGGLTLSGGEPLSQFDFSVALLKSAKENELHTCIETSGFTKEDILKIAKYVDIFLFDWKLTDSDLHKKYTDFDNARILENLKLLDANGSKVILRCPIIPSVNDTDDHLSGIANLANSLQNVLSVEIEPYHSFAQTKYNKLGKADDFKFFKEPTEQEVDSWIAKIKAETNVTVKKA